MGERISRQPFRAEKEEVGSKVTPEGVISTLGSVFPEANSALAFWDVSQVSSVTQSCPTLCDPMDCSTPGFPVHHQLLELAQTHVHPVSDAIQPSHPVLSQHQGLFQ